MSARATLQTYYRLTKPGIIYGNAITAIGGFLLASGWHVPAARFIGMLIGLSFIIASGCVYNNYIDRGIDRKMARTRKRAVARGDVSGTTAVAYATILGVAGSALLLLLTNTVTLGVALFGLFAYVVLYSIGKRTTVHSTLIGSISGAVPPVVGYCAVTGRLDTGAALLFVAMVFWQMPHFYAIGMFRRSDYAAAGLPILPVVKGLPAARRYILVYIVLYLLAASLLSVFHYTGLTYAMVMALACGYWLWLGIRRQPVADDTAWARKMFGFSLVMLLVWSGLLALEPLLP